MTSTVSVVKERASHCHAAAVQPYPSTGASCQAAVPGLGSFMSSPGTHQFVCIILQHSLVNQIGCACCH